MKKLMTILLVTATFSSAHAIWSGPSGGLGPIFKSTPKRLKELSPKKVCGVIRTTGFAKRAFIETNQGDVVRIKGLLPKVEYAKGCAYGKVTTRNYRRTIFVSKYRF